MRTESQKKHMNDTCINLYNKIVAFKRQFGYVPTIRELCNLTGTSGTATMRSYLLTLQKWGWIARDTKRARRAYRLTRPTEMDVPTDIRLAAIEVADRLEASGALEAR